MENKFTKKDIENYQRTIGHYALPANGIRTRRGTKKTKIKWRNIIPALLVGGAVSFAVWQIAAYCCGLMHMTMLVPVWVIIDSVVFMVASMVALMRINAISAQRSIRRKIDPNKARKLSKLSELKSDDVAESFPKEGRQPEVIKLNKEDSQRLADALLNPPEPSQEMIDAARRYKERMKQDEQQE